ncbi:MAG TPA: hypothetical protein VFG05_06585 [Methylocella sp.]|nr:hypothetical protein [Methylocella sp.]
MTAASGQVERPSGREPESLPVLRLPPIEVRTAAEDVACFLAATPAPCGAGDFVPLTFPFRWMTLPEVRSFICEVIGPGFLPLHESQSFLYERPLRVDSAYVLAIEACRSANPPRLTVCMAVSSPEGEGCAKLEAVLRIIPAFGEGKA